MTRVVAAALGLAMLMGASTAGAESRFSLRGNGEAVASQRADHRALGGAEAATRIPSLSGNPASLVFAEQSSFFGTYDTEWIRTEESQPGMIAVRKEYSGLVPNLGLVFPLPKGWRFGLGLLVTRRRGGTIEQDATVPDGNGGTITYRQEYDGSGNELRIPFLFARDVGGVQVGSGIDLVLLRTENRWLNDFSGAPAGFLSSEDTDETNLGGVAWRTGVRVPVGDRLALGGWVSIPSRLSGDRILSSDQAGSSADLTQELKRDSHRIFSAGVEIVPVPRVRLVADWTHEPWTDAEPLSPIDEFVDVNRFAFGLEWQPEERRGALNWPIRAGYRTELLHVLDAGGREVREHVLSAGSGFGIAGGRGDIDWYVEYGWRGQQGTTEYLEHVVRFGVTLTGLEQWSRGPRPEEEDDW